MADSLDEITIRGYKSIKSLESFKLNKLNVLIGANGVGKSNFISFFKLVNSLYEQRLQSFVSKSGGVNNILFGKAKVTQNINFYLKFGWNAYEANLSLNQEGGLYFESETCYFHNPKFDKPYRTGLAIVHPNESNISKSTDKVAIYVRDSIKSWRIYHFHDTSDTSSMRLPSRLNDNMSFNSDGGNLASYLYLLKNKYINDYNNIVDTIRMIAPFFRDFNLRPDPLNTDLINLEWSHIDSDEYYGTSALSDGTLRFMSLATLLLQPKDKLPATILLDEPELGLHPSAIQLLSHMLKSTSAKTQVIASTQSVTLIDYLQHEDIIIVERGEDNSSQFKRLTDPEIQSWMQDYSLGELWNKNLLGARP